MSTLYTNNRSSTTRDARNVGAVDCAEGLRAFGVFDEPQELCDFWEGILRLEDLALITPYSFEDLSDCAEGSELSRLELAYLMETCITPHEVDDRPQ